MLPKALISLCLQKFHDFFGHFGSEKTDKMISNYFFFNKRRRIVNKYVRSCVVCQTTKQSQSYGEKDFRSVISLKKGELVSADLFGPLPIGRGGASYVFVILDVFTKYIKFYAIKRANTKTIIHKLIKYFEDVQKPKKILVDRGTQFASPIFTNQLIKWGITVAFTSVRHPQANPVERYMKELGRLCRAYCNSSHQSWANKLINFEEFINNVPHFSTGFAPHTLQFEKEVKTPFEFIKFPENLSMTIMEIQEKARNEILRNATIRAQRNKVKSSNIVFQLHQKVLLKSNKQSNAADATTKKFFLLYEGPYCIGKILHKDTFVLVNPLNGSERGIFNTQLIKPYYEREEI